jgi:hypothetical protein
MPPPPAPLHCSGTLDAPVVIVVVVVVHPGCMHHHTDIRPALALLSALAFAV